MNWNIIVTSLSGSGCEYRLLHELRSMGKFHMIDFKVADYIVAAETVGHECGVALLTRDLRQRYPFVLTR